MFEGGCVIGRDIPPTPRRGDWMQTYTGKAFFPLDPNINDICIEDIAHSLSLQCRFAGHIKCFYSVAQHSVYVSQYLEETFGDIYYSRYGLLHDASEAYLVDLPRPVKNHSDIGRYYKQAETLLMEEILKKFNLYHLVNRDDKFESYCKQADNALCLAEKRDLLGPSPSPWSSLGVEPWHRKILPLSPKFAEEEFLQTYYKLFKEN